MDNQNDRSTVSKNILLIDDSQENRSLLTSQLMLEGYQTIEAASGHEGIALARAHDPDIILLDVMMPGIDGFEVCQQLKNDPITHRIPIIMITASQETKVRLKGKKAGVDDFLSRPYLREELMIRVQVLIQFKHVQIKLEEERNRLRLLYELNRTISNDLDLKSLTANTIIETQRAFGAHKGAIVLLDEDGKVSHKFLIRINDRIEIGDSVTSEVMKRGLGGWLIENRTGDIINDIAQDARWLIRPDDAEGEGSAIGVPLLGHQGAIGFLILNHPTPNYFQPAQLTLLETIATTVTAAIQNATLFAKVSEERQKLSAILAQASDVIMTTNEEKQISMINQAAEHLFGIEASAVIGKSLMDIPSFWPLISLFSVHKTASFAGELPLSNDKVFFASLSSIKNVGYVLVLQDITEMKRIDAYKLAQERLEKKRVKETFARYMGPSLVEHVLENVPNLMARRERRQAVVMFADIRNFTQFTRLNEPNEVVECLNVFFTKMSEVVYRFDGVIFELTGDELLIGFNAPFAQEDAPSRALQTAVSMHQTFNGLRETMFGKLPIGFGMGIGIDQGTVVVGNVGAETRMTFRMVGDAVNFSHRLVDIALDRQIIISQSVYQSLNLNSTPLNGVHFDTKGPLKIKGRNNEQFVYEATIL
jgi:class 3 adenylate cyclase/CheY-like chemotaxis protein